MKKISLVLLLIVLMGLAYGANNVYAIPTLQTYIEGATAGDYYGDQDTWYSSSNPLTLWVMAAYGPNTTNITGATLLVSVPNGETGTLSIEKINTADESPVLLTVAGTGSVGSGLNPTRDVDASILTNVAGNDGYATVQENSFLPFNFNNHYPLQDPVSDFLIYDLFSFGKDEIVSNYNADDGSITGEADGEVKEYRVTYSGFSQLHFDVYALETTTQGKDVKTTWQNNPGSHDSTANPVPEPATMLLLGPALVGLAAMRKKNGVVNV